MKLTGHSAIEAAENNSHIILHKYADPIEDARVVTPDEARSIAREDPSLIWASVPLSEDNAIEYLRALHPATPVELPSAGESVANPDAPEAVDAVRLAYGDGAGQFAAAYRRWVWTAGELADALSPQRVNASDTNSLGIIKAFGPTSELEVLGSVGVGDQKLTLYRNDSGQEVVATNGDPIFEGEDGFADARAEILGGSAK